MNDQKPNRIEIEIVKFVYENSNPYCKYRELKKAAKNKKMNVAEKTLFHYLYGNPNNIAFKSLVERDHLIVNGKREYNGTIYDDDFTVNKEKLYLYPEIRDTVLAVDFMKSEKDDAINAEENLFPFIIKHTKMTHDFQGKEIFFSNSTHFLLKMLVANLIREIYLMNPETWYILKNPKDYKFNISLECDFTDKYVFNTIKRLKHKYRNIGIIPRFPFHIKDRKEWFFEITFKDNKIKLDNKIIIDELDENKIIIDELDEKYGENAIAEFKTLRKKALEKFDERYYKNAIADQILRKKALEKDNIKRELIS